MCRAAANVGLAGEAPSHPEFGFRNHWRHRKVFNPGNFWKNLKGQSLLFRISTRQKQ